MCHLLLGRPWQHNVDSIHKGKDNLFIFYKDGKKITLTPVKKDQSKASKGERKSFLIIKHLELELEDGEDMYIRVFPRAKVQTNSILEEIIYLVEE